MNSAPRIPHSALGKWLPDMDLNHDKQIQSLLCYRYTIGQTSATKLDDSLTESSRSMDRWIMGTHQFLDCWLCIEQMPLPMNLGWSGRKMPPLPSPLLQRRRGRRPRGLMGSGAQSAKDVRGNLTPTLSQRERENRNSSIELPKRIRRSKRMTINPHIERSTNPFHHPILS
jgi:hypothetical protein